MRMLEKVRPLALEPAPGQDHPPEQDLRRFMKGELTRPEAREVVRHLLTGCPQCKQVTQRLWTLSDRRLRDLGIWRVGQATFTLLKYTRRDDAMTEAEAQAQAELQEIVRDLGAVCARLESIHDRLPVPLQETAMLLGEEEMDVSTEVRSVIECAVHDSLRPLIRDLAAAATYLPQAR
jgi:hypothetical protein